MNRSVRYYNERIDKNCELKRLINDKIKKRNPEQQPNEQLIRIVKDNQFHIKKRLYEIQHLLNQTSTPDFLSTDAINRLKAEKIMLENIAVYQDIKNQILKPEDDAPMQPSRVFEKQLLDLSFYKREKPQRRGEVVCF